MTMNGELRKAGTEAETVDRTNDRTVAGRSEATKRAAEGTRGEKSG
jgi:hypothetical protein